MICLSLFCLYFVRQRIRRPSRDIPTIGIFRPLFKTLYSIICLRLYLFYHLGRYTANDGFTRCHVISKFLYCHFDSSLYLIPFVSASLMITPLIINHLQISKTLIGNGLETSCLRRSALFQYVKYLSKGNHFPRNHQIILQYSHTMTSHKTAVPP